MTPRKVTPTKWADVKARIAAKAAEAEKAGKTLMVTVVNLSKS
jgi:hypothetical protein